MLKSVKRYVRHQARRFLDMIEHDNQGKEQVRQIAVLQTRLERNDSRLERLEQIVYLLEESHYRAINDPRPRRDHIFVGDMDNFIAVGEEFLNHFQTLCHLQADECVLDVGCGIGRMALPLTKYLSAAARYEGFDIVKDGIDWCIANITSRYPNFHFQFADVRNDHYNPIGQYGASEYHFPYSDESFDFVFLTSVFTHMLPPDMKNYLCEVARVLRRGGRALITFFLWNPNSTLLITTGKSLFQFQHEYGVYRV